MLPSLSDFSFVLCPGNRPDPRYLEVYKNIYSCWHYVWSEAFKEMGVEKKLHSDAFTRQDLIGAAFYKNECIGMAFFRWTDASRPDFALDSYFDIWNDDHRSALCSRGNNVIVCSNLTLHPNGRGKKLGLSGKDLIVGLSLQVFLNSKADAMTGAMRVDRGANSATARWGRTTIAHRVPCEYGEDNTELVGFYHDVLAQTPRHELQSFTETLWSKRVVIERVGMDEEYAPAEVARKTGLVA